MIVSTVLSATAMATATAGSRAGVPAPRPLPRIEVHRGGHYLQTDDGKPFFWLGDTAWQLVQSTTREECSYYLRTRASQGFTVIQAVVLAEFGGVRTPTALGLRPFQDEDPSKPVEAYFDRVAAIVDEAAALGLYVALLPSWGDKLTAPWGDGPRLFHGGSLPVAQAYGKYLGTKLKDRTNVVWMLGGDRPARVGGPDGNYIRSAAKSAGFPPDQDWTPIWREMAGGHDVRVWEWITRDWALTPAKPTLDLEPNYEDHPFNPWPRWDPASGYFRDHDVRKQVYRSVFAGGCGVTYGHHAIWQFASARNGIVLARLRAARLRAWWYDPRTGIGTPAGEFTGGAPRAFRSPPSGPDWVLVLDDVAAGYAPPGL